MAMLAVGAAPAPRGRHEFETYMVFRREGGRLVQWKCIDGDVDRILDSLPDFNGKGGRDHEAWRVAIVPLEKIDRKKRRTKHTAPASSEPGTARGSAS